MRCSCPGTRRLAQSRHALANRPKSRLIGECVFPGQLTGRRPQEAYAVSRLGCGETVRIPRPKVIRGKAYRTVIGLTPVGVYRRRIAPANRVGQIASSTYLPCNPRRQLRDSLATRRCGHVKSDRAGADSARRSLFDHAAMQSLIFQHQCHQIPQFRPGGVAVGLHAAFTVGIPVLIAAS